MIDGGADANLYRLSWSRFPAVIVPREGARISATTVQSHLIGKLAKIRQPNGIFVVGELPRNAMGKVPKKILRDRYANTYANIRYQ